MVTWELEGEVWQWVESTCLWVAGAYLCPKGVLETL